MKHIYKFLLMNLMFITSNNLTLPSIKTLKLGDLKAMINFVKPYLPKNPVILEAGAFDGSETIKMKTVWPESKIYTFEPVTELYEKLKYNTRNLKNVHCFKLALSDKDGMATFYLSENSNFPGVVSMSSSLLKPKEHLNHAPEVLFKNKIAVQTITLNKWSRLNNVTKIDFLWLDMQGYELNALKATPKNLLDTVRAIVTEVEFTEAYKGQYLYKDVKKWLEEKGFVLIGKNFDEKNRGHWFGDAIFVKKNLIKI